MDKLNLLKPGDWTADILPGPWVMGTELEFAPPEDADGMMIRLLEEGIFLRTGSCRQLSSLTNFLVDKSMRNADCCVGHANRRRHMYFAMNMASKADLLKLREERLTVAERKHLPVNMFYGGNVVGLDDAEQGHSGGYHVNGPSNADPAYRRSFTIDSMKGRLLRKMLGVESTKLYYPWSSYFLADDPTAGYEMKAPPLDMTNPDCNDSLKVICEVITEAGGEATANCGLHVHANVRHLTDLQVRRLVIWYQMLEPFLLLATDPTRLQGNEFTRPWLGSTAKLRNLKDVLAGHTISKLDKRALTQVSSTSSNHYSAMSLRPLNHRGTVEFRSKEGTLSHDVVWNWMLLLQRFVYAAVNTKPPLIQEYYPLAPSYRSVRAFLSWLKLWPAPKSANHRLVNLGKWYLGQTQARSFKQVRKQAVIYESAEDQGEYVKVRDGLTVGSVKPTHKEDKDGALTTKEIGKLVDRLRESADPADHIPLNLSLVDLVHFDGSTEHLVGCRRCADVVMSITSQLGANPDLVDILHRSHGVWTKLRIVTLKQWLLRTQRNPTAQGRGSMESY